jgi:molybdenum cofactor cytidylyltransferase
MQVDGIVLAAGRSTRMGQPKALLEAEPGVTFLERAIRILREAGCRYVIAVINEEDDWTARLADVAGGAVVVNDDADSEQIDSVRLGIAHLPDDSDATLVLPVDIPGVKPDTVDALIREFERTRATVVLPRYQGRAGHPVLFARAIYGELMAELPSGAESIVEAHAADRREVEVDDPGILVDVDQPDEYREFRLGG